MTLRTYLTRHTWWGKLLGAGLGFLAAGPSGALLGVFIGNFFDRGLSDHYSKPHWSYHTEKRKAVRKTFQNTVFSIMGHIAKANGRVSEKEIVFAKQTMRNLNLNRAERTSAQAFFRQGKAANFNMNAPLYSLKNIAANNPKLLREFVQIQYQVAQINGLTPAKINILNNLLNILDLAPLHEQPQAREKFYTHSYSRNRQRKYSQEQEQEQEQASYANTNTSPFDNPYILLNVSQNTTKQDVKRAYRRLISQHHPDKCIAEGRSENEIKKANEKTQTIRKAYESICKANNW
ncbi:MAG: co-chaperone DjlA [Gammaproteobacteria bacterium]|nr:co-chaperone DjlA [Gammaproteobacteria bacterium]